MTLTKYYVEFFQRKQASMTSNDVTMPLSQDERSCRIIFDHIDDAWEHLRFERKDIGFLRLLRVRTLLRGRPVVGEFIIVIRKLPQQPEGYERIGMVCIEQMSRSDDEMILLSDFGSLFNEHRDIETVILC
jgi:hypothetical protein